jgi:tRNA-splicing endonuclease subunit Sen15
VLRSSKVWKDIHQCVVLTTDNENFALSHLGSIKRSLHSSKSILGRQAASFKHITMSFMVIHTLLVQTEHSSCPTCSAQQWTDVEVVDLETCQRGAIKGRKRGDAVSSWTLCRLPFTHVRSLLPGDGFACGSMYPSGNCILCMVCPRLLSMYRWNYIIRNRLKAAFELLSNPPEIFLAITSQDASIVYYKISLGIVKPPV